MCREANKSQKVILKKKLALACAYADSTWVPQHLKPVGDSNYTSVGHLHDWLYSNPEAAYDGSFPQRCELVIGGQCVELRGLRWREQKGKDRWTWTWEALYDPSAVAAGTYLLIADQRAVQLSGGGGRWQHATKLYLMRMVGTLVPLPGVPSFISLANARPAAAETLAELLKSKSNVRGGSNTITEFGSILSVTDTGRTLGCSSAPAPTTMVPSSAGAASSSSGGKLGSGGGGGGAYTATGSTVPPYRRGQISSRQWAGAARHSSPSFRSSRSTLSTRQSLPW